MHPNHPDALCAPPLGRGSPWPLRRLAALTLIAAGSAAAQPPLPAEVVRNAIASGDSAWERGARDVASVAYRRAVSLDSGTSTRVVFRLATLETERNRLEAAGALLRLYVRREPADSEGRLALARVLAWQGRYDQALAQYDVVLRSDSTYRDAALGRAQALAWANRFPAALAAYEQWLIRTPGDSAAELALATTLTWAGRLDEAEAQYAALAKRAGSVSAERGVARVTGWRGDLARSEQLWRAITERHPDDVESWIGLAQVQRWAGRSQSADTSLRRALALAPSSAEAREQWQQLRVERSGAAEPSGMRTEDSDGNRMTTWMVTAHGGGVGQVRVRLTGARRDAAFLAMSATSTGARAAFAWSLTPYRLSATTEFGATRLSSRGGRSGATSHTRAWALMRVASTVSPRVSLGLTYAAVPFDETATLIAGGIHTRGLEGDLSLNLPRRLSIGVGGGRTTVEGGAVPNARRSLGVTARWGVRTGTSLALAGRGMAYDTTGRADGYFAPRRFTLFESSLRQVLGGEVGWGATLEGGIGRQGIRFAAGDPVRGNMAARGSVALRFTPLRGYELEAAAGASSVASPFAQGAAEYSVTWFSLRGRLLTF